MTTAAIELGAWRECPCPSDAPHDKGSWSMAKAGSEQHPLNVRALWQGDELLAVGGVVEIAKGDGLAFVWGRPGLSPMLWRRIMPALIAGLYGAHERGMRRIFAVVTAAHGEAIRLIKRLGFQFFADDTGWPSTREPVLRYMRAWPPIEAPALVDHQRREYERACLATWCPELVT